VKGATESPGEGEEPTARHAAGTTSLEGSGGGSVERRRCRSAGIGFAREWPRMTLVRRSDGHATGTVSARSKVEKDLGSTGFPAPNPHTDT